jgi:hypothetical protein
MLQLTVAYLNVTINVQPETQNWRLEPRGLVQPGKIDVLMRTGPSLGLPHQVSAGWTL